MPQTTCSKASFWIVLLVAFLDFVGLGLVYPMFSSMLFDHSLALLPANTSEGVRGMWLGVLLAMLPFTQFFTAPIWGALSDSKGRKKPLAWSLVVIFLGYIVGFCAVLGNHLLLLLTSRILIGFGSGNMAIVQATIADLSSAENKAKNFALYGMALGAGFTVGPLLGGTLSTWGFEVPFLFSAGMIATNLALVLFVFKETCHQLSKKALSWTMGLSHLKKAFGFYEIRVILFCSFLHNFAWSYFFEFIPVYLIRKYHFSASDLGLFYGVAGGCYALSAGLLIRPFLGRFKPELLFFGGNCLAGLAVLSFLGLPSVAWLFPLVFLTLFFVSFVTPTSNTVVSNSAPAEVQGEAMGVLSSVNALALVLSPLFSGSLVGNHPSLPMWVGGALMLCVAIVGVSVFRKKLF
jgi:DHA1 family tetracycline resistance protein-like MFS transporter